MNRQHLFLELNEINFDNVAFYCRRGRLPALARLIDENGWTLTSSEERYEELEPWIQWVTAHTGATLAEHRVFRLGDIVHHDLPQIWEQLEAAGLRVGAISPMNAKHRLRKAAFFVPDPWTRTQLTAPKRLEDLYAAIAQAVNDNAQARLTAASLARLIAGFAAYARPQNYAAYLQLIAGSVTRPWRRAILLDQLLADVFIRETERTSPHFATLFVNAGAHIQHHYLFSAACYSGTQRNPDWYLAPGQDPVYEVYAAYDRIVASIRERFPSARLMIATGLHQDPHERVTFYWRLRRHAEFLRRIGVPFVSVEPRMSRDFLVVCTDPNQALTAAARLKLVQAPDGEALFEVDNRGCDLFVTLVYAGEITRDFRVRIGEQSLENFKNEVAFVALKNGEHNGAGYFLDSERRLSPRDDAFPLARIPMRIKEALGVHHSTAAHPVAA
jgi:hypothetical protein